MIGLHAFRGDGERKRGGGVGRGVRAFHVSLLFTQRHTILKNSFPIKATPDFSSSPPGSRIRRPGLVIHQVV